ncbi:MAG: glycoside hydrolase family 44 protein [Anaerolineaceae bacterium]|nr:glycoside hydrolase family 44 protein [Anaerolineaceae bacterium]
MMQSSDGARPKRAFFVFVFHLCHGFKGIGIAALLFILALIGSANPASRVQASRSSDLTPDVPVFTDALASDWQDWSWSATIKFSNTNPVHTGSDSLAVTYTGIWGGLYLHTASPLVTADYTTLSFWVHGGTSGGQSVSVKLAGVNGVFSDGIAIQPVKGVWSQVNLPISSFTNTGSEITGLVWQDSSGNTSQPIYYLDDVVLTGSNTPPQPITLAIDVSSGQHAISPYIYGMSFADAKLAADLRLPVNRWGGNAVTRYSWQNDTSNHASDWYFENIPNDNAHPENLPNGSSSDQFVAQNLSTGTQTLLTVPLIGWTPKSRAQTCGFSVKKYGPQQLVDPWSTDCGNGIKTDGVTKITGNDPTDTSSAITPAFVQAWMGHLAGLYGNAAHGGVRFYDLDNEPMLWNSTHRDVHPNPTTYDELRNDTYAYAAAIKASDPAALTFGPVLWGWSAYFDSAAGASDRAAHNGQPFLDWYLDQMHAYQTNNGVRILDYLDIHFYPQGDGIFSSDAGNSATQALRLRSTRALWDPTYIDESWINDTVRLIPRMHDWVDVHYPGTKLSLSEYSWGALNSMNGALAQAEVLGIFGREGLDLASLWGPPAFTDPGAYAFRMYRNYDGSGAMFGDTSFQANSSDPGRLSIFGARRSSDGALTLMIINKTSGDLSAPITFSNFTTNTAAHLFRYSASNLNAIQDLGSQTTSLSGIPAATYPANSISLLVIPPASNIPMLKTYLPLLSN